jgi:hypothetical protein
VNRLKVEFPDRLKVVSVDVQSSLGKALAPEYGKLTPTFIFFDGEGDELWRRIGTLEADEVRQSIKK